MKIGELAVQTGTLVETIRFYEREGLLPEPTRTAGNYRIYEERHVLRMAFIRQCRVLDMTLDEIRSLLRFMDAPKDNCGEVNALLDDHIEHVAIRIRELKALERDLRQLREQCGVARPAMHCGILEEISRTAKLSAVPKKRDEAHLKSIHGRAKSPSAGQR